MQEGYLELEAFQKMVKALDDYRDELVTQKTILKNAADVCDVAMGSDEIAQKYIQKLDIALEELNKTVEVAENTESVLLEHIKKILGILKTTEEEGA